MSAMPLGPLLVGLRKKPTTPLQVHPKQSALGSVTNIPHAEQTVAW